VVALDHVEDVRTLRTDVGLDPSLACRVGLVRARLGGRLQPALYATQPVTAVVPFVNARACAAELKALNQPPTTAGTLGAAHDPETCIGVGLDQA
jgi:hypothetical protein